MAEDLLPTIVPGMVGLKNKKSGKTTNHFPVDAREILTVSPGEYEIVDNGAAQAARLNANPLKALEVDRNLLHTEVTGIEGQVLVAMSPEDAEAWKKRSDVSGTKDPVTETKEEAPKEAVKDPKEAGKTPAAGGSASTTK